MLSRGQSAAAAKANRLLTATSPYLQQHAYNPVGWYEWGEEALAAAQRENKPIFLSIGYSACHWCHVMAHESFEDAAIAEVMNRLFINVKVDREERPDIDDIYMQATLIYTRGQGGWPMSVWLTPERKPFFAGTYFPPVQRWGRPGFREICERIGELWMADRAALEHDAAQITEYLRARRSTETTGAIALTLEVVDRTVDLLTGAFDTVKGGLLSGGTNKFPPGMAIELMLRSALRRGPGDAAGVKSADRALLTLDRMADGGIRDQLAGGFHRYSTDADWLVPHFEKMLYDQALLSRAYLAAYQFTGERRYAETVRSTLDYVLSDLRSPAGAFYSTRDADSEGEEGRYYVWTREEIEAALGADEALLFCDYYNISERGNWDDPHAPGVTKNILHVTRSMEQVAAAHRISTADLNDRLTAARNALLRVREKRTAPHRDEKILCEWNGLMIASLARSGAVLYESRYIEAAEAAARFILHHQSREGRLLRSYRDGRTLEMAFLADYACMIDGLLDLYEATSDEVWLAAAVRLDETLASDFWDEIDGGYFTTAVDHEPLIVRPKDFRDGASPSGNSVQLANLLRLATLLNDGVRRERARRLMERFAPEVIQSPGACERFLAGVEFAAAGSVEIVLIGPRRAAGTQALRRAADRVFVPNRVLAVIDPEEPGPLSHTPLAAGRTCIGGEPAAYVCRGYTCRLPVTTPEALTDQLRAEVAAAASGQ